MRLLPATPLAELLGGYFLYTGTPLEVGGEEGDNKYPRQVVEDRDPVDIIMVGLIVNTLIIASKFLLGGFWLAARFTFGESHCDRGLRART